jgi:hypothetical protein
MSWLESLSGRYVTTAIFNGVAGLFKYFGQGRKEWKRVEGRWLGVAKEYKSEAGDWGLLTEAVQLKIGFNRIIGDAQTTNVPSRHFELVGRFEGGFLTLNFHGADLNDGRGPGAGVCFLQERRDEFIGYVIAFDRDKRELVSCPYVLSRQVDWREVKSKHSSWLDQGCLPSWLPGELAGKSGRGTSKPR